MKRLISLFAVVLTVAATNAQLRVDSLGNVKSDKSLYSYGPLSVTTSSVDAVTIFPNSTGTGCTVKILNGGKIQRHKKSDFALPYGISLEMDDGSIFM